MVVHSGRQADGPLSWRPIVLNTELQNSQDYIKRPSSQGEFGDGWGEQLGRKHTPVTPALGSGWKNCELKASLSYTKTLYQKNREGKENKTASGNKRNTAMRNC